jgi:hypothetical protein
VIFQRGDGVGIEFTRHVVRGVRLGADEPDRLVGASEVGIGHADDDRSVLDALVRLRAELDGPTAPTRVATFASTNTLHRLDVTGFSADQLSDLRTRLRTEQAIASTVLLDDGPRRWLIALRWDEPATRRLEDLVERSGFHDVTIEPSPIALARVLGHEVTRVRRDAAPHESFDLICERGIPVVSASVDSFGRTPPTLAFDGHEVPVGWFDEITGQADLAAEVQRLVDDPAPTTAVPTIWLAGISHPPFPPHDLRSPQRQCVALGAALGAAGLAGRLRPVDIVAPFEPATAPVDRPWAVERVSNLPPRVDRDPTGPLARVIGRFRLRRRSP